MIAYGCGVNVAKEDYEKIKEVDFLAENTEDAVRIIEELAEENENFEHCEYEAEDEFQHGMRRRALLKIQDGCNSYCTYCIIPTARGPEFSENLNGLIKKAQRFEEEGFEEIVLTGINICEWKEGDLQFEDLIEQLVKSTSKVRFRISSIEPKLFAEKLYPLFASGRLCPHMHMSLQSGSNSVLKRMRRKYGREIFKEVCERLKEANANFALSTDVIIGFPGETEEEFEETMEFCKEIEFLQMHVFPFSRRKKTVAYHMKDQITDEVKKERCRKMRELSEQMASQFQERMIGKEFEVLFEAKRDNMLRGYSDNYLNIFVEGSEELKSQKKLVKITSFENGRLIGQLQS